VIQKIIALADLAPKPNSTARRVAISFVCFPKSNVFRPAVCRFTNAVFQIPNSRF
jgi:hypothetical protein